MAKDRLLSMRPLPSVAAMVTPLRPLVLLLASALLAAGAAHADTRESRAFFERIDANGDGVLDAEELRTARRDAFKRADTDGDGFVTGDEVQQLGDVRGDVSRVRRGVLGGGIARRRMPDADDALRRLDADRDGRISESEFVEAENPLLERFDANGDGEISRDEIERAQQRTRELIRRRGVL